MNRRAPTGRRTYPKRATRHGPRPGRRPLPQPLQLCCYRGARPRLRRRQRGRRTAANRGTCRDGRTLSRGTASGNQRSDGPRSPFCLGRKYHSHTGCPNAVHPARLPSRRRTHVEHAGRLQRPGDGNRRRRRGRHQRPAIRRWDHGVFDASPASRPVQVSTSFGRTLPSAWSHSDRDGPSRAVGGPEDTPECGGGRITRASHGDRSARYGRLGTTRSRIGCGG